MLGLLVSGVRRGVGGPPKRYYANETSDIVPPELLELLKILL
jgi:hypothetical protein